VRRPFRRRRGPIALIAALVVLCAHPIAAQELNLGEASLEQLMNIQVTSISKKEQDLFASASAIFVITADDLRRSGATSVAEALRLVPGATVGQLSGSAWRVGVRGFSGQFSDKVLVLVDGMSVYLPTFGGVSWGTFEPALDSIERIEVIRGPGAVVWGANAVNGVVNIITKETSTTQGSRVSMIAGTQAGAGTNARYGGRIGSLGHYRIDAGASADGRMADPGTEDSRIQRRIGTASMRVDLQPTARDRWQIYGLGSVHRHYEKGVLTDLTSPTFTTTFAGVDPGHFFNVMAQWTRQSSPSLSTSVRVYGMHNESSAQKVLSRSEVVGLEALRRMRFGRHDLIVSGDARWQGDVARANSTTVFSPERHHGHQVTAFAQDEITLVPSRLTFTGGAKVSDTDLSSSSVEPNVRLAWTPALHTTVWAAVSGADRIPTRFTLDGVLDFGAMPQVVPGMPTLWHVQGTRALRSEGLRAYEAGYRVRLGSQAVVDTTAFVNQYRDLVGPTTPVPSIGFDPVPHVHLSSVFENGGRASARGGEVLVQGRLARLQVDGSYAFLDSDLLGWMAPDPRHSGNVGATVMIPMGWEASARWYFAKEIVAVSPLSQTIPAYDRLDLRLARSIRGATLAIVGQNLTRDEHSESDGGLGSVIPVPRSIHTTIAWRF
jgi:iron complex outermembrane receptor protein